MSTFTERTSKPLRSSVVKLRYYKKSNAGDKDDYKHLGKLYKTLYLLSLTPDALQLSTTSDASDDAAVEPKAESTSSSKTSFTSLVKAPVRAMTGKPKSESAELSTAASNVSDTTQDLPDNQMFTISVSLNQILSVSIEDGNCVKVLFRPNKVSRRKEREEFTTVMKGLLFPVWFPVEAGLRDNWDPETFMENHLRKDPSAHTILVEASNIVEAESLKAGVDQAISRLRRALEWISKDLPMLDGTSISLISMAVKPAGSEAATKKAEQVVVATHPTYGSKIALPDAVGADIALSCGAGKEGVGGTAVLHVWMNTPLGPAEVELVPAQQLQDAEVAAGCPFTLRAVTQQQGGVNLMSNSVNKLEVLLRCSLTKGEQLPGSFAAAASRLFLAPTPSQQAQHGPANLVELLTKPSEGVLKALVAAMAILLILWTNVTLGSGYSFFKSGLLLFATLAVATLAMVMVIGATLMKGTPGVAAEAQQAAAAQQAEQAVTKAGTPPHYQWFLEVLEADVVESSIAGGAPPLMRTLSTTAAKSELAVAKAAEMTPQKELPPSLVRIVEQHPEIVTENIAERFLVGWKTPSAAYAGLNDMVKWVKGQGLEGVLKRPQPYFQLAKKHYKHGCYGVSKGGLPVEVEVVGKWKNAYEIFIKAGVTETDMLHHLVFSYNYTFTHVDPRPLPYGRTVKIVDLAGLGIGDMRHNAVKFFTQVGALLNLNYPQRLHKCFLVNAPTWWAMFWKLIRPMISKETRDQIILFAKNDKDNMRTAILEEVDADQFPVEYGGSGTTPLYETKYEKELLRYVESLNNPQPPPQVAASGVTPAAAGAAAPALSAM